MRAVVLHRHGGPEQLQVVDRPEPIAGFDEVVVDVAAVAVNRLDIWVRENVGHAYQARLPLIPGYDVAGTVSSLAGYLPDLFLGSVNSASNCVPDLTSFTLNGVHDVFYRVSVIPATSHAFGIITAFSVVAVCSLASLSSAVWRSSL